MKKVILATLAALAMASNAMAQSELYPQHFDLEEVTLLDGPLKTAQDLNIKHLMSYDVDRLLTPFVRQSGLGATTNTKSKYYKWESKHPNHANWGSPDFDLSGHIGGHYMTALALAYAACDNATTKAKILERIDYIVGVVKDCQDAYDEDKTGMYGFVGGQPMNANWQKLYKGDTDGFWNGAKPVPFYCQHKILAGLRDIAIYTEDSEDFMRASIAREMFRKMCDWSINVVAKLSDDALQRVLWTEHGGMNETLADAYKMFGDSKYLKAAKRYSDMGMVNGMQTLDKNFLSGKHANTQVPKYVGFIRVNQVSSTSTNNFRTAAQNFWTDVTKNRTVCIGGNSVEEHFLGTSNGDNYIDKLDGPESCNTNNMLKLTEDLFDTNHDSKYADYYEAAMYNHILSTQDPKTGGYVYFTPLRPQSYRIYSKVNQDMWCCVGTGMENHEKYGHFIYTHYEQGETQTLYVNLFTASTLKNETFALTQTTEFPYEQGTKLTVNKSQSYTLAIRKPSWVGSGFSIRVNGAEAEYTTSKGYAMVKGDWKEGDVIEVSLPMELRYEPCPLLKDYIAFKYGPILLGARTTKQKSTDPGYLAYAQLNHEYAQGERMGHAPGAYTAKYDLSTMPMLIGDRTKVLERITPVEGKPLTFTLDVSRAEETAGGYTWSTLTLEPYYSLHHSRVNNYFYQATYDTYMKSTWAELEREQKAIEERTVDQVDMGKQQSEAGVVTYSSDSGKGTYKDEDYRDTKANGWMQIVLTDTMDNAKDLALMLRYQADDKGRMCKIYVNDVLLKDYKVPTTAYKADGKNFYQLELPLGKLAFDEQGNAVTRYVVRIVASSSTPNPGLYYIRLVKDSKVGEAYYKFKATDWAYSGDGGRLSQDKIKVDKQKNTITMTQSGNNNICLKYGATGNYEVPLDQKYLVIRGTNLSSTSGKSYVWWLNGKNQGSSVAPTKSSKLADGRTQLVWDISKSGIDANCQSDPWILSTSYNSASTTFGLTATNSSQEVTISYIGFMSEAQLNGNMDEPEGDMTAIELHHESKKIAGYYNLNGMPSAQPQRGVNIIRYSDGSTSKVIKK
ncbi:MAG: glycoside hydrolase family 127 protein [Bacteroidaceae bacterium]|nr:glycoside hydrolase family 127 protein [Bacteroidaceae bacterium]